MFDNQLAARLVQLRKDHQLSLQQLAQQSGISTATLSRIENAATSPTASQLNSLCNAFGITLSQLMYAAEAGAIRLLRSDKMMHWTDPDSGYQRRLLCPPTPGFVMELLEISLPPGADIQYDKPPIAGLEQHIVLHQGNLHLTIEQQTYQLSRGDSLGFKLYGSTRFVNPGDKDCIYILAVAKP
ncbi:XRE family transcriptional regulator [Bowmanella denitrificans]|uniref:XRE family transcriptional regulator n=1 Tax=Bowmanella denitrificans TaxID=366582 RepID=A0ABN0XEY3_9ALTE